MVEQIEQIVQALDLETRRGLRDKAVLLLGWCGAMRRSELANLTWSQIKFMPEGLQITIHKPKQTGKAKAKPLVCHTKPTRSCAQFMAIVAWAKVCAADTQSDLPVFTRIKP
jgi:integrase